MPRALALAAIVAIVAMTLPGCGAGGTQDGDGTAPTSTAPFDCSGLADRWVAIQQEYLDRLGDADRAEVDGGSERVDAAAAWFGPAVIEQVRDARNVGCDQDLEAGSELLCARFGLLEPGGEAAQEVVDDLVAGCATD